MLSKHEFQGIRMRTIRHIETDVCFLNAFKKPISPPKYCLGNLLL